ncbi:MAG: ATP-dependent chaperone ClpB, partial [Alphaproteobacteria bacterium]|nr:ATP-dependent chaperone ClpB [Alphaproteobacteria bacterium]
MNLERYTQRTQGMLQNAQMLAIREGHQQFNPLHLLKVLLDDPEGLISQIIQKANPNSSKLLGLVHQELSKLPKVSGGAAGQVYLSPDMAKVFEIAEKTADKAGDKFVSVDTLLLALIQVQPTKSLMESSGLNINNLNESIE